MDLYLRGPRGTALNRDEDDEDDEAGCRLSSLSYDNGKKSDQAAMANGNVLQCWRFQSTLLRRHPDSERKTGVVKCGEVCHMMPQVAYFHLLLLQRT